MNDIINFNFIEDHQVRVILIDSEPWFVAKDVTDVLGFQDGPQAVRQHVLAGQTQTRQINGFGRPSNMINEPGLYRLIMRSNVAGAEQFQIWVTEQVLPSIRKYGAYATGEVAQGLAKQGVNFYEQTKQHHSPQEIQHQLEMMVADKKLDRSKLNFIDKDKFEYLIGIKKFVKSLNEFANTEFTSAQVITQLIGKKVLFKKSKTIYPYDQYRHLFYHYEGNEEDGTLTYNIVLTDDAQIFVAGLLGVDLNVN